ncbi:MAG: hypothetical protein KFH87_13225 [Bacteroidetes bacterium]|nr:hypothetical protein [Bacteroidota bacterium]
MKMYLIPVALFLIVFLIIPDIASACPNCKEAYVDDGQSSVSSGFNNSILFMMAVPFLVVGTFALRLWFAQRKRDGDSLST